MLRLAGKLWRRIGRRRVDRNRQARLELRRCLFESMEPRQLLAASPLVVGAVYVEQDLGSDEHGDAFHVTFGGGAAGSELTRLVISTDQGSPGFSLGDAFFDVAESGRGADRSGAFVLVAWETADAGATVRATVADGGLQLVLDFNSFRAGDRLVFQIDVDEVELFDELETDLERINEGFDPITSGVEFQGSQLRAEFSAPHYHAAVVESTFLNRYDGILQGTSLDLPADNHEGLRDRTAGAAGSATQRPLPISLAGNVFLDNDLNRQRSAEERGLPGVALQLWQQAGGSFEFTGFATTTDAAGAYAFGTELDLQPGTYQVREAQPAGLFSVAAIPGLLEGDVVGAIVPGDPDTLTAIAIPLGGTHATDLDFAEAEPAALSGWVYHDRDNDGRRESGEEGLAGVQLRIEPLQTIAAQEAVVVQTGANGAYSATGLAPGVYRVLEVRQPADYFDGLDAAGTVGGIAVGIAANSGDAIDAVALQGGQRGIEYNFGELVPASIRGTVRLADREGNCTAGSSARPLGGVLVQLSDADGRLLAETRTDAAGEYRFDGLSPGVYRVVELTPADLIDGAAHAGEVNGRTVGVASGGGVIADIELASGHQGIRYDFCELAPAALSGHVFHDRDNNGRRSVGEEGLEGVALRLLDAQGQQVASARTDPQGRYAFDGLRAGTYTVLEVQPGGWIDGLDQAGRVQGTTVGRAQTPGDRIDEVLLRWGDQGEDYDFGELLFASIAGSVHLTDAGGSCYLPGGSQPPLAGVRVELRAADGQLLAEAETDTQGRYRFDGLLPGEYTVVEYTPAGLIDGPQRAGTIDGVTVGRVDGEDTIREIVVSSGQQGIGYDFCEYEPASLSGFVFHDLDNDGLREGEPAIAGARVELWTAGGSLVAATRTDAAGVFAFRGLSAGEYVLREVQPEGYRDGLDRAGTVGGALVGRAENPGDQIDAVFLRWGDEGVDYSFGEWVPGSIAGRVVQDLDGACGLDGGELPLAGVLIELLDEQQRKLAETRTDAEGRYRFDQLAPGTYAVREQQPAGFFQGCHTAGSAGGDTSIQDLIRLIPMQSGDVLIEYNFSEIPPSSLEGDVFLDPNRNRIRDEGEAGLASVPLRLRDAGGTIVATAQTDASGHYRFTDLRPGVYVVEQTQPAGLFDGGQREGSHGGDAAGVNAIADIGVPPGQQLTRYDFAEFAPGSISGYVFVDGSPLRTLDGRPPASLRSLRDGLRTPDDRPLAGVVLALRHGVTGEPISGSSVLGGQTGDGPLRAVTGADGFYLFAGLPPGSYAVYEVQPVGYFDGIDWPGNAGGEAVNADRPLDPRVLARLLVDPQFDAVLAIPLLSGGHSAENNFSEVAVERLFVPPDPPSFPPPPRFAPPALPPPPPRPPLFAAPPYQPLTFATTGTGGVLEFSWHLSVVDAGMPRGVARAPADQLVFRMTGFLAAEDWLGQPIDRGLWLLPAANAGGEGAGYRTLQFGSPEGTPLAADWNGDGIDEVAIYLNGLWYVDLNGNGRWDEEDLWAQLGTDMDVPVAGDWNGDGKDDIGIFGPAWAGDPRALQVETGLPDLRNRVDPVAKPKNVPPPPEEATDGVRLLRHTPSGPARADVIDHVFRYGDGKDVPVTGDWSGDGIVNIGVFRDGQWRLDADGDGRWSDGDRIAEFGQAGDLPVVGDFNGDGVDEIAVFRNGTWIIDVNGNQQIDAHDLVLAMGQAGDLPVAGDWNGDGIDEPAVYRPE